MFISLFLSASTLLACVNNIYAKLSEVRELHESGLAHRLSHRTDFE